MLRSLVSRWGVTDLARVAESARARFCQESPYTHNGHIPDSPSSAIVVLYALSRCADSVMGDADEALRDIFILHAGNRSEAARFNRRSERRTVFRRIPFTGRG